MKPKPLNPSNSFSTFRFFSSDLYLLTMDKKKALVGILFLLFLIELAPTIVTNSQTPPSASAYVGSISVSSNPFILNTTLPAINQLGSNIRFFQYPNLTGQLYAYEQQLPQTTPTVNDVESTSWKTYPYWENGELVVNSTGASNGGQYIAWRYSPVSNTINVTIHVTSFPEQDYNPGIDIFSANPSTTSDVQSGNYYWLAIQWSGYYQYETPTSGVTSPISSSSIPNLMGKVFTETVILTENSAGNITISQIYVNGTLYSSPDINIPFPWNQIYWIGIRGDINNLFYVSYFSVSPSPYYNDEQFVNNVESTSWKIYPYWQNGELVVNSTGASTYGQYIAWRYSPVSNVINITIHMTSFPSRYGNPGIDILSPNIGDQTSDGDSGFYVLLVDFYGDSIYFHSPTSGFTQLYSSLPQPNPNYPFTMTVIFTENSAGNVTVSTVYINGTAYSVNVNTPFPWKCIGYVGIRGDWNDLFYVSYFSVTQMLDAYSLVTNPTTNTPYTGTVYVAVFPYPISYDVYVSPAPIVNSQSPLPMFSPSFTSTTTLYPVISTNANFGVINIWTTSGSVTVSSGTVIPSIGAWTSVSLSTNTVPNFLVNGTVKSGSVSGNTITLSGLTGTSTVVFPDNFIPSSTAGVTPYNATFNEIKTTASSLTFTVNTQMFESGVPVIGATLGENWYYYGFYSTAGSYNIPLFLTTLAVGNQIYANIPTVESTSWRVYPYWEDGELVINSTGASIYGQYIAWKYSPISNVINITIHVTSFPSRNGNPGIEILSPNVGDQSYDGASGFYVLLVDFYGNSIFYHTPTSGWGQPDSSLPQPNPNYPFTMTVILTENSAGNVTVSTVYINSTAYSVNLNIPFPWSWIGYVGIRGDIGNLFYVSYFGVNSIPLVTQRGATNVNTFYSPYSLNYIINETVVCVCKTKLSSGFNSIVIPGSGFVASSFAYVNTTSKSAVLVILNCPYVIFDATSNGFEIDAPRYSEIVTDTGMPQSGSFIYEDPTIILCSASTFVLPSYITTAPPPPPPSTTSTPPPSSSSSSSCVVIEPNSMKIEYNGSLSLTLDIPTYPEIVKYNNVMYALPFTNSSGAYFYLYDYNTSAKFDVTFKITCNGKTIVDETVPVNSIVKIPVVNSTSTVCISALNETIKFTLCPVQLHNFYCNVKKAVHCALSGTPLAPFGCILVFLFFGSFALSALLRNDLRLMGMGGITYAVFIAPGLLQLGFPSPIIIPTEIVSFVIGVYALWISSK
ncbi:hypothetical protein AZ270_gp36 [Acidianus tailed spindle virus]|uniref:hypothetical protein n=1 Tax=Acidianus tailed spindle virus TaxID=1797140 RepID=UPI00076F2E1A|nr:hypothetical protein AZ270_gp36 [Acidianus tailed spindle virus]AME30059.1 hypothetical protein ATSV_D1241 [Acidianus tailed spindle virus]